MTEPSPMNEDARVAADPAERDGGGDALSRTAGPDGHERAEGTVPRSELQKVIQQRQAAKQRARQAEQRLAELHGDEPAGRSDPAETGGEIDVLRSRFERNRRQLAEMIRHRSLHQAAEKAGALNPEQVVAILAERVVMAEADDGTLAPRCLDDRGEVLCDEQGREAGVDALVRGYLSDAANANLLLPTALPGSGARPGGFSAADPSGLSLGGFNALPADQRRRMALSMTRTQRERMLGLGRTSQAAFL